MRGEKVLGLLKTITIIFFLFNMLSGAVAQDTPFVPVVIDFFYEAGCAECIKIKNEVFPKLEASYSGLYTLNEYDRGNITNLYALVKYQEILGFNTSASVYLVIDYSEVIYSSAEAVDKLLPMVEKKILERYEEGWGGLQKIDVEYDKSAAASLGKERLKDFTLGMVIVAGLVDGINPCAIATIIFFITFLSAHRVKKNRMLLAGLSFCFSCFIVYILIGFGAFSLLLELREKYLIKEIVEWLFVAGLLCLSLLSLIDAVRLKRGIKNAIIKLPSFMGGMIRKVVRSGFSTRSAIVYGAITGAVVTLIETACTGQTYLPTLQLLVELDVKPVKSFGFLVIYNLMFVMPLVILLGITIKGISTYKLTHYMKTHAVIAKILMSFFFLVIAALLLLF